MNIRQKSLSITLSLLTRYRQIHSKYTLTFKHYSIEASIPDA